MTTTTISRWWLDDAGQPHEEQATWLESTEEAGGIQLPTDLLAESTATGPIPTWGTLVSVTHPAADPDAWSAAPNGIYDAPLREGATLVGREDWNTATEAASEALAAQQASVATELAARTEEAQAPRRAALAKLAEATGLTAEDVAALMGEAG